MHVDHLLIDAKNCIYRAIHAGRNDERYDPSKRDYFIILMRFLHKYLVQFSPRSIHIFWDEDSNKIWRLKLLPSYKGSRSNDPEVEEQVRRMVKISKEMFANMGMRQYYRDKMEADDLIYTFAKLHQNEKVIIVSSDGDMMQIPYYFDNISVHNPLKTNHVFQPKPDNNPAEIRSLTGDRSDNIEGFNQIGPKRASALLEDKSKLHGFLEQTDDVKFRRNLALIDLSLCPYTLSNIRYTIKVLSEKVEYNEKELRNLALKHKVVGFMGEFNRCVAGFKSLVNGKNN